MNHTVNIIYKQIKVEAFTVYDYYHLYPKFLDIVLPYMREGKITYVEDIAEGLKNGPAALEAMFEGRSAGKQVVLVAHE